MERKDEWTKIQKTNKTKKTKRTKFSLIVVHNNASAGMRVRRGFGENGNIQIEICLKHNEIQYNETQWNTMKHNTRNGRNGQEMGALSFGVHPALDDYKALYASRELFEQVRCVQHFLP